MNCPSTTFKHNGDLDYMRDEKDAVVEAQDSSCQRKNHRENQGDRSSDQYPKHPS